MEAKDASMFHCRQSGMASMNKGFQQVLPAFSCHMREPPPPFFFLQMTFATGQSKHFFLAFVIYYDNMNDVCRFSRDHVVECSERTVLSCLEPVCLCWRRFGRYSPETSPT